MRTRPPSPVSPVGRLRAWLVTGPLGRFAAIVLEIGAALVRVVRRRTPTL